MKLASLRAVTPPASLDHVRVAAGGTLSHARASGHDARMATQAHHFPPPAKLEVGGYALDAVALEYDDETGALDFRLQLGGGLCIYWALPAAKDDRLRLALVDGAAFTVDEPVLTADPFVADLPRLEWDGEDRPLGPGRRLKRLALELTAAPPGYRCEATVALHGAPDEVVVLAWSGSNPGGAAPPPRSS